MCINLAPFSCANLTNLFMSSSLSVMNGNVGFIIIPVKIPFSLSFLIASNLLEDVHTCGSIILAISSLGVVIVNLIITLFFLLISFNKSISLIIRSLFVSIDTP